LVRKLHPGCRPQVVEKRFPGAPGTLPLSLRTTLQLLERWLEATFLASSLEGNM
jgi:hypothetical protein